MKIAHCADLHLGKKNNMLKENSKKRYDDYFLAFERMIDKILELKVDVLIIAGDLFDKKEIGADVLEKTENIFKKLENKIQVLVIDGNHDFVENNEESWIKFLNNKKLIKFAKFNKNNIEECKIKIEDINFYLLGYFGSQIDEVLEETLKILDENEKNIIITHTALFSDYKLPGLVDKETIDKFKNKVIYIAGGHIHSFSKYPKDNPFFFIPGSLEFINVLNEKADRKGFILFDSDTKNYEFIELESRKRIKSEIFRYENIDTLQEEFLKFIKNYNLSGQELFVLNFEQKIGEYIDFTTIKNIAMENGAFGVYLKPSIKNNLENYSKTETFNDNDIEREIIYKWNILKNPDNFIKNFEVLKNLQNEKNEEEFFNLLNQILEDEQVENKNENK